MLERQQVLAVRYTVHTQSVVCPDGFSRNLFYVWDNFIRRIVASSNTEASAEFIAERANAGSPPG